MGLARQFKPIMARRCTPKVVLSFVVPMVLIMPVGPMGLLYMRTALLLPTLIAIGTPLIGAITSMATGTDSVATGRSPGPPTPPSRPTKFQAPQLTTSDPHLPHVPAG